MTKIGVVTFLAIAVLAAFGSTASAQLPPPCREEGPFAECVKSPVFHEADDVATYLVISAFNLLVEGGDDGIAGDSWTIKASGKERTTGTAAIGTGCTPPTSGYTGQLPLLGPSALVTLVTVEPNTTPNGFPAQMYVRFRSAVGPLFVMQIAGEDGCDF